MLVTPWAAASVSAPGHGRECFWSSLRVALKALRQTAGMQFEQMVVEVVEVQRLTLTFDAWAGWLDFHAERTEFRCESG